MQQLDADYVRLTGIDPGRDPWGSRDGAWYNWVQYGLTEGDLAVVVRYICRCIAESRRGFDMGSLRFSRLIGQPDKFSELLGEIRALARSKQGDSARQAVLRATGRDDRRGASEERVGQIAAKLVSDPVKAAAALDELRKLGNAL